MCLYTVHVVSYAHQQSALFTAKPARVYVTQEQKIELLSAVRCWLGLILVYVDLPIRFT